MQLYVVGNFLLNNCVCYCHHLSIDHNNFRNFFSSSWKNCSDNYSWKLWYLL